MQFSENFSFFKLGVYIPFSIIKLSFLKSDDIFCSISDKYWIALAFFMNLLNSTKFPNTFFIFFIFWASLVKEPCGIIIYGISFFNILLYILIYCEIYIP